MSSEHDPERLRAGTASCRTEGKAEAGTVRDGEGLSQGEVAYRMVLELATGILVWVGIGYGWMCFSARCSSSAIFSWWFAAGVRTMLGTARQLQDKTAAAEAAERERDWRRGDGRTRRGRRSGDPSDGSVHRQAADRRRAGPLVHADQRHAVDGDLPSLCFSVFGVGHPSPGHRALAAAIGGRDVLWLHSQHGRGCDRP